MGFPAQIRQQLTETRGHLMGMESAVCGIEELKLIET